jgi:hypothetical protein
VNLDRFAPRDRREARRARGLDPDGRYHPVWTPAGKTAKDDVPGKKAEARRLTRVRRFRYYPVRVRDGRIEVALPGDVSGAGAGPAGDG